MQTKREAKEQSRHSLRASFKALLPEEPEDDYDAIRIRVKYPDSNIKTRRFRSYDRLQVISEIKNIEMLTNSVEKGIIMWCCLSEAITNPPHLVLRNCANRPPTVIAK